MKAIILALSCILTFPLIAQSTRRAVIPPGVPGVSASNLGESEALKKNITIRLHGTTTTGSNVDLSLCGIGPRFTVDHVADENTFLNCQYSVFETDTGYKVSYTVMARVKVATQVYQNNTNYEYRDVTISGTVLCSSGSPQNLVLNGSKPLQLTITEESEKESQ